jgi:hypothetical protein
MPSHNSTSPMTDPSGPHSNQPTSTSTRYERTDRHDREAAALKCLYLVTRSLGPTARQAG